MRHLMSGIGTRPSIPLTVLRPPKIHFHCYKTANAIFLHLLCNWLLAVDLQDPTVIVHRFFNFPLWFGFLQRFWVFCYFTTHSSWACLWWILTSPSLQSFTLITQVDSMIPYNSSESFFSSAYFFITLLATLSQNLRIHSLHVIQSFNIHSHTYTVLE